MAGTYGESKRQRSNPLTRDRYPIQHNEPFLFVHMPTHWELVTVDGEPMWLPRVGQQPLARGANGIEGDAKHRDPSVYAAKFKRKGGTVIEPDDQRLGPYQNYVLEVECQERDGSVGTFHHTEFEELNVIGGRTIPKHNAEAYQAFQLHLLTAGIVKPMSEVVLDVKVDGQERRVQNQRRRAGANKHLAGDMEDSMSVLEAMRPAWEKQFGTKPQAKKAPKKEAK